MVTTRYSDQQGSKSRQKVMRLYKRWHRPISKRFIKPPYSIREQPRSTRNVVAYPRPAFSAKNRKNYAPTSFDQQVQVSQGHTFCTEIRKIEIPRSMVVKLESLVIADQDAAVNTSLGLAHTARHVLEVYLARRLWNKPFFEVL